MSLPYIGEIRIFANTYAPQGWLRCDGTICDINEYAALFSVIGSTYGGNGRTTFGLPNLVMSSQYPYGRAPGGAGLGSGLTYYILGESFGESTVLLDQEAYLPPHNHLMYGMVPTPAKATSTPQITDKIARYLEGGTTNNSAYSNADMTAVMADDTLATTGAAEPHANCQPFLSLGFYIAHDGIYPSSD